MPMPPKLQVMPSVEVALCPTSPTVTKRAPDQATPRNTASVACMVQVVPFGDVWTMPALPLVTPTATNRLPVQASPSVTSMPTPEFVCGVQVIPSGDVAVTPPKPAARNMLPFQTIVLRLVTPVRGVQVTASGELMIVLVPAPTATYIVPLVFEATPAKPLVTPLVRLVQVIPSGEVRTVPLTPTATNCIPDQVRPASKFVVPDVRAVHVAPSGEVRMVPVAPTATMILGDAATACRSLELVVLRAVQVTPSGEVRMSAKSPTTTNCDPVQVTPFCVKIGAE